MEKIGKVYYLPSLSYNRIFLKDFRNPYNSVLEFLSYKFYNNLNIFYLKIKKNIYLYSIPLPEMHIFCRIFSKIFLTEICNFLLRILINGTVLIIQNAARMHYRHYLLSKILYEVEIVVNLTRILYKKILK